MIVLKFLFFVFFHELEGNIVETQNQNKEMQVSDFGGEIFINDKKFLKELKSDWLQKTDLGGALGWLMTNNFHVGYNDMLNLIKDFVGKNSPNNGNFKLTKEILGKILDISEGEGGIDAFLGFVREISIWLSDDSFSMILYNYSGGGYLKESSSIAKTVELINIFDNKFENFVMDKTTLESILKRVDGAEAYLQSFVCGIYKQIAEEKAELIKANDTDIEKKIFDSLDKLDQLGLPSYMDFLRAIKDRQLPLPLPERFFERFISKIRNSDLMDINSGGEKLVEYLNELTNYCKFPKNSFDIIINNIQSKEITNSDSSKNVIAGVKKLLSFYSKNLQSNVVLSDERIYKIIDSLNYTKYRRCSNNLYALLEELTSKKKVLSSKRISCLRIRTCCQM